MYVVTGSTGHVGANLIHALIEAGKPVRAVVRSEPPDFLVHAGVEVVRGDVLDVESLRRAFAGAEVIYHLAAMISIRGDHGGRVTATNVDGAHHVATCAHEAGVRRLVHFSSCHAFDLEQSDSIDETSPRPGPGHTAYDRSKAMGEARVREVIARGLDAVIVNPTSVIGPHDYKPSRIGKTLIDLRDGRLPGSVAGAFDWVDARDVVAGALAAEQRGVRGANYLLGGHWLSISELLGLAAEAAGVKPPWLSTPMWLARLVAPIASGSARLLGREPIFTTEALRALSATARPSSQRAIETLGYHARPMTSTMTDTFTFFREQGM